MRSDPVQVEQLTVIKQTHRSVKTERATTSVAPQKITAILTEVIESILKKNATKALTAIFLLSRHSTKAHRVSGVESRMWL